MARSTYVVTYDIADDKRRDKVFTTLQGFGDHTQYSVFVCDLSESELVRLRFMLRPHIHGDEDQVLFIYLGRATRVRESSIEAIGKPYDPPVRSIVI